MLMYIQKMKEEEERRKAAMAYGQRPGPQQGMNDSGMTLEQMFQRLHPTLMQGMQQQQPQPPPQQLPPGLM